MRDNDILPFNYGIPPGYGRTKRIATSSPTEKTRKLFIAASLSRETKESTNKLSRLEEPSPSEFNLRISLRIPATTNCAIYTVLKTETTSKGLRIRDRLQLCRALTDICGYSKLLAGPGELSNSIVALIHAKADIADFDGKAKRLGVTLQRTQTKRVSSCNLPTSLLGPAVLLAALVKLAANDWVHVGDSAGAASDLRYIDARVLGESTAKNVPAFAVKLMNVDLKQQEKDCIVELETKLNVCVVRVFPLQLPVTPGSPVLLLPKLTSATFNSHTADPQCPLKTAGDYQNYW